MDSIADFILLLLCSLMSTGSDYCCVQYKSELGLLSEDYTKEMK